MCTRGTRWHEQAHCTRRGRQGSPTATKKVMLEWGQIARGQPHFWSVLPPGVALQLHQALGWCKVVQ